jgi:hypothetical protein
MKEIIPKDTRYVPFTQQKSCCVPASISIVMYKLGIPLVPQELLGYRLGLIVSKENKNLFWNVRTGKKPKHGYGTRIGLKQYNPNLAFKKLNIPFKMIVHNVSDFKLKEEFISFIDKSVKKDKNVLVCFNGGVLNNNKKINSGHVCVIDKIYIKKNTIRLVDPSSNQPKWKEVKIDKLKKAMELHPTKGGAFWELEKI